MSKIGFIGLGDMGQVIVPRLLEAGHTVAGWNRSPGKSENLEKAGMKLASSPAEAAKDADIVLSIVTDGNAVTQKNKFKALDLGPYFDLAIFSGDHQLSKPDLRLFKMFETHFSTESNFYYIADNPKKDFYGPNQLGWTSIQILNPLGIYRDIVPKDGYNASLILSSLDDLTPIFDPT